MSVFLEIGSITCGASPFQTFKTTFRKETFYKFGNSQHIVFLKDFSKKTLLLGAYNCGYMWLKGQTVQRNTFFQKIPVWPLVC